MDNQGVNQGVQGNKENAWKDSYTHETNLLPMQDIVSLDGITYRIMKKAEKV